MIRVSAVYIDSASSFCNISERICNDLKAKVSAFASYI